MLAALLVAQSALPSQARLEAAAVEAVAGSCPEQRVAVAPDLTRACRAFAAAVQAGRSPVSGSAASFFASLESAEPAPVAGVATVSPPDGADRAVSELFPKTCRFNRIGVAAAKLPADEALVCVLTAPHETDLEPIPGRVDALDEVKVAGRLAAGLSKPRLFVTRPSGEVQEQKIAAVGSAFSAKVRLAETGEHSIEVLAEGPGGPQVVAMRRVFAGVDAPASPPAEPGAGKGLGGVEAAIAQLRAARGLPLLERDAELDAVAESHSREMARTKTFAHVLPSDGSLTDRLRARGYAYRSAGENIGLSDDAATAHEAIVQSPAHLSNLLDPRHRRLGLGAVKGPTAEGTEGVYLTEVLAAPVVGSADPAADIAAVLARERKKRGLRALLRDPALDDVAGHEVRSAALSDQTRLPPMTEVPGVSEAVGELSVSSAPDELAASKNNAEPKWTRLGVGAMYASSKRFGPGRLWVVLLYGR